MTVSNPFANKVGAELKVGERLTLQLGDLNNEGTIEAGLIDLKAGAIQNSGTINGGGLLVESGSLNNTKTVSGGNVQIKTGTLTNTGAAALILASNDLSIETTGRGTAADLLNQDGATIYSGSNMALNAGHIRNFSSTVEAGGNLSIKADLLENTRELVKETVTTVSDPVVTEITDL